ncbi:hypothetical protein [Geobacter sp.]|uniref:hypothetical protein n=1 Tax=Geobacter sp. TaxID=46610 RepID=UPI0027BA1153|nr:hypothetical protein [Geobacter sp.]
MGKKVLSRFAMGCAAGVLLVAAGCGGGGGGGSSVTPTSVSGVVADGYLVGAEVFLDKDGDKVWGADEPKATTGTGGAYTLAGVSAADIAAYPIVVRVPADAVDADTGAPVGKEYLMSAPPGEPEFVSPLTTLVHNQLEENPALGVSAAVEAVKSQLGMTGNNVDLFKDYVAQKVEAASSDDRDNYAKAHEIAKVVAAVVKDNLEVVGTSAEANTALKVALAQVTENLPLIVGQVTEAIAAAEVNQVPVDVDGILQNLAGQVIIDPGVLEAVIAEQEQKAPAVSSSFKDALAGDGFYWFDEMYDDMYGPTYEYGIVKLGTASGSDFPLSEQFFRLNGGVWGPGESSDTEYVLVSGNWIAESDSAEAGTVTFAADGSAIWTRTESQLKEKIVVSAMDMKDKPIMLPGNDGMIDSGTNYPAGSILYKMVFTPLQDVYSFMEDSAQFPSFTNLNDFMAAYTAEGNYRIVMGENFGFQFGAQTAQDAGEVKFYLNPFAPPQDLNGPTLLPLTGSWKRNLVYGQTILTVTVPAGYKQQYIDMDMNEELIFFVHNGGIQQGHVEYANVPQIEEGMNFNKTAFDAFMAAWSSVQR